VRLQNISSLRKHKDFGFLGLFARKDFKYAPRSRSVSLSTCNNSITLMDVREF
jgi:hypothetical protein